jgi:hypothetical protein
MSQFFIALGDSPGEVPTSFPCDVGTAVPAAHVLQIKGSASSENDSDRIRTTGAGNVVYVELTNTIKASTTTSGASSSSVNILTNLAAGVYVFDIKIVAFSASGANANAYAIVGAVVSDGITATLMPNQALDSFELLVPAACSIGVSGNNAVVNATGSVGVNYNWTVVGNYMFGN